MDLSRYEPVPSHTCHEPTPESGSIIGGVNWAVGTFAVASIASFEFCHFKRNHQRVQMKRAVEIVHEKRADAERQKLDALQKQREEQNARSAKEKAWYRFW